MSVGTWHEHIYKDPPRQPTAHFVSNILGLHSGHRASKPRYQREGNPGPIKIRYESRIAFQGNNAANTAGREKVQQGVPCKWTVPGAGICGRNHATQDHVVEIHGKGFVCLWQDCHRQLIPFTRKHKLTRHVRTHTGVKPFKCLFLDCRRTFASAEDMKYHVRRHTDERPYVCPFPGCSRRFVKSNERKSHVLKSKDHRGVTLDLTERS
ncbi:hypothetical protein OS493_008034 [Desmophyllum pertusum]|uniref:C2H2-type domain-containing protein n=1 Tax=Desmophyllum pertusum TaxID=174260 RepID=A0A9X0CGC8_9CNID|nr:hypothetical protein OS493_008034 [Desmophyllum pertusum]